MKTNLSAAILESHANSALSPCDLFLNPVACPDRLHAEATPAAFAARYAHSRFLARAAVTRNAAKSAISLTA